MYQTPSEYFFRLHHIRPRFKNDVENVLFYIVSEIAKISPAEHELFKQALNKTIRYFPGNNSKNKKQLIIGELRLPLYLD